MYDLDTNLDRLIGWTVRDKDDDKVGTVNAVFADSGGRPTFLGIRTGWLGMGRSHLVPARLAEISEGGRIVRVPYDKQMIKDAPEFDDEADVDYAGECAIYDHFGVSSDLRGQAIADDAQACGTCATGADIEEVEPVASDIPQTADTGDQRLVLNREEVEIGKRKVEAGGVRLRKIVRTEIVNQPVELTREEVVIERVPATSGSVSGSAGIGSEQEIFVPLWREEAVVERRSAPSEEVVVRKQDRVETQQVAEEIRKEDVEVEHDVHPRR